MAITVYTKPACAMQCHVPRTLCGIEYDVIDITENAQAHDYVMSLIPASPRRRRRRNHWSGFRPDEISKLTPAA